MSPGDKEFRKLLYEALRYWRDRRLPNTSLTVTSVKVAGDPQVFSFLVTFKAGGREEK